MSLPDDIRRGTLKAAWSDTTGDRGERFDELATDMDAWKKASARAHATIDEHCRAIDGIYQAHASSAALPRTSIGDAATKRAYRTTLDCDDDPAPIDDPRPAALAALVSEAKDLLFRAHAKATATKDERRWKLLEALNLLVDWP